MSPLFSMSTQPAGLVTSIGISRISLVNSFFLHSERHMADLKGINGLTAGALYRSVDHHQVAECLQWQDLTAFQAGVQSAEYLRYQASNESGVETVPCDVVYVDDARPGTDAFDSVRVRKKTEGITLISRFTAQAGPREDLLDLLRRDHESFLHAMAGFVGVAFLRAIHDDTIAFELLQFASVNQLKAVSHDPKGAAHLAAVSQLTTADHNVYQVQAVIGPESEDLTS